MPHHSANSSSDESRAQLIIKISVVVICRLLLSTARRFAYPFAPVLSRGLGVPLTAITSLIAVNWATSLLGIVFGPLADRFGYRRMMIFGMAVLAIGMLAGGFIPVYGVMIGVLFLAGLGKIIFDPAVQAYVSERVPYKRRATAIGLLEISWAGSTLLGIPVIAILIEKYGWRSPFFVMGVMALACVLWIVYCFSAESKLSPKAVPEASVSKMLLSVLKDRQSQGVMTYVFFFSAAIDNLFVIYGAWLEEAFDVGIVALGLGTGVIGIAELLGEVTVAAISDRFGLKRVVSAGVTLCIVTYALLPIIGQSFQLALVGLFIHFLFFEFTIISSLALCTELQPGMRATLLSGFFAAAGLGRIFGALIGGPIWLAGGIAATGSVSAVLTILALISLRWGLRNWHEV